MTSFLVFFLMIRRPPRSTRTDTLFPYTTLFRSDGQGSRMLSIPRDLLVTISETGQTTRINAAFNGGPRRLVATLRDQLQLPIPHYLEVDFVAFRDLVDALGGITITFPHPATDHMSGLNVAETGDVRHAGTPALASVRSPPSTPTPDSRPVPPPPA